MSRRSSPGCRNIGTASMSVPTAIRRRAARRPPTAGDPGTTARRGEVRRSYDRQKRNAMGADESIRATFSRTDAAVVVIEHALEAVAVVRADQFRERQQFARRRPEQFAVGGRQLVPRCRGKLVMSVVIAEVQRQRV